MIINESSTKKYVSEVRLNTDIPLSMAIDLILDVLPDGTIVSSFEPHVILINSNNKLDKSTEIQIENLGIVKSIEWYKSYK